MKGQLSGGQPLLDIRILFLLYKGKEIKHWLKPQQLKHIGA